MDFSNEFALLEISPLWVVIFSVITGVVVKFWGVFKSTFELKLKNKQDIEIKKTEHELTIEAEGKKVEREQDTKELHRVLEENKKLAAENEIMKGQIMSLTKSVTYLSTALDLVIDEYAETNPQRETMIARLRGLVDDVMMATNNGEIR
jgi:hypothetical protein